MMSVAKRLKTSSALVSASADALGRHSVRVPIDLMGSITADKGLLIKRAESVMENFPKFISVAKINRSVDLLANAAALGVKLREIFLWADALYKRAHAHYQREAALYARTNKLRRRADERYGAEPLFRKRKEKINTIAETLQQSLTRKSRERAIANYIMGVVSVHMNEIPNAIILGFSRACQDSEVARWIDAKAKELESMAHKCEKLAQLQAAMAMGLVAVSKPGSPEERRACSLMNGYKGRLPVPLKNEYTPI